jgi:hypothetical protein
MSQGDIIFHPHSPTNLAHRGQPPKHLQYHRENSSETNSSSGDTSTQSDSDSRSIEAKTRATTPEPIHIPCFPLRDLLCDPSIYPTHKFVNFCLSPLPHFRPTVQRGCLHLLHTPFCHISHAHSLKHKHFCKDSCCTAHILYSMPSSPSSQLTHRSRLHVPDVPSSPEPTAVEEVVSHPMTASFPLTLIASYKEGTENKDPVPRLVDLE